MSKRYIYGQYAKAYTMPFGIRVNCAIPLDRNFSEQGAKRLHQQIEAVIQKTISTFIIDETNQAYANLTPKQWAEEMAERAEWGISITQPS